MHFYWRIDDGDITQNIAHYRLDGKLGDGIVRYYDDQYNTGHYMKYSPMFSGKYRFEKSYNMSQINQIKSSKLNCNYLTATILLHLNGMQSYICHHQIIYD